MFLGLGRSSGHWHSARRASGSNGAGLGATSGVSRCVKHSRATVLWLGALRVDFKKQPLKGVQQSNHPKPSQHRQRFRGSLCTSVPPTLFHLPSPDSRASPNSSPGAAACDDDGSTVEPLSPRVAPPSLRAEHRATAAAAAGPRLHAARCNAAATHQHAWPMLSSSYCHPPPHLNRPLITATFECTQTSESPISVTPHYLTRNHSKTRIQLKWAPELLQHHQGANPMIPLVRPLFLLALLFHLRLRHPNTLVAFKNSKIKFVS